MKGSWKTTLAGLLAIVSAGIGMVAVPLLDEKPETAPLWMEFFGIAFAGLVGLFARDNGVTSEAAGAKPAQPAAPSPAPRDPASPLNRSGWMILLAVLLTACLPGCWGASREATRTVESMEASAVNFARNRDKLDEGFLQLYREQAQAKADELAAAAMKAEVKLDGTANARNLQLILEKKAEHYARIEGQVIEMRKKIMQADPDMLNLLEYSKALRGYFAQRTSTGELLNASGEQAIGMLTGFLGKKKAAAEGP